MQLNCEIYIKVSRIKKTESQRGAGCVESTQFLPHYDNDEDNKDEDNGASDDALLVHPIQMNLLSWVRRG